MHFYANVCMFVLMNSNVSWERTSAGWKQKHRSVGRRVTHILQSNLASRADTYSSDGLEYTDMKQSPKVM